MKKGFRAENVKAIVLTMMVIVVAIIIINEVMAGRIVVGSSNGGVRSMETVEVITRFSEATRTSVFTDNKNGYFTANKDGATFTDFSGNIKMNYAYNLTSPVCAFENGTLAVSESRAYMLYVFNEGGLLYSINTKYPVLSFSLNQQAWCSVIMHDGEDYRVLVYNSSGVEVKYGVLPNKNVFPVASDISNDNRILAISYFDINDAKPNSKIDFLYLDKMEGLEYTDSVFAASAKNSDQIIFRLEFMANNLMLAISEKNISCCDLSDGFGEKWRLTLPNKLTAFELTGYSGFLAALGEGRVNMNAEPEGTLIHYSLSGVDDWRFAASGEITKISYSTRFNAVLAATERQVTALTDKGSVLYEYIPAQKVSAVMFYSDRDANIAVFESHAAILKPGSTAEEEIPAATAPEETAVVTPTEAGLPDETETPPTDGEGQEQE